MHVLTWRSLNLKNIQTLSTLNLRRDNPADFKRSRRKRLPIKKEADEKNTLVTNFVFSTFYMFSALYLFLTHFRLLTTLGEKPLENIVGKEENVGNQHFLLFPQCFQPYQRQKRQNSSF